MQVGSKTNKLTLVVLIAVLSLVGFVALTNLSQRKTVKERAAVGDGQVVLSLLPANRDVNRGDTFTGTVKIHANSTVDLSTAGVDIQFDPNVLTITSPACGSDFSEANLAGVTGNKVLLSCIRPADIGVLLVTGGTDVVLGTYQVQVKSTATLGATSLTIVRGVVAICTTPDSCMNGAVIPGATTYTVVNAVIPTATPAVGGGQVSVDLQPGITQSLTLNSEQTFTVVLKTTSTVELGVADMDFTFNTNSFRAGVVACGSVFSQKAFAKVVDNKIFLTCQIPNDASLVTLNPGATLAVGTFKLTPILLGSGVIQTARVVVPDPTHDNVFNGNLASFQYSIQSQNCDGTPNNTCSTTKPKRCENGALVDRCGTCGCVSGYTCQANGACALAPTATPTIPRPTATPTAPQPTATPTPPAGNCPLGQKGDLNCSGRIDIYDLVLMIDEHCWGKSATLCLAQIPTLEYSPDISGSDGIVNNFDLARLLRYWTRD